MEPGFAWRKWLNHQTDVVFGGVNGIDRPLAGFGEVGIFNQNALAIIDYLHDKIDDP